MNAIVKPQYKAAQTWTDSYGNSKMHSTYVSAEDHPSSPASTLQSKTAEEEEEGEEVIGCPTLVSRSP